METDGQMLFSVQAMGAISQRPDEREAAALRRNFAWNYPPILQRLD
jgi:hypothetical protein